MNPSDHPQIRDPFFREMVRTSGYLRPIHVHLWFLAFLLSLEALFFAMGTVSETGRVRVALALVGVLTLGSLAVLLRTLASPHGRSFLFTTLKPVVKTRTQPIHWFARFVPLILTATALVVWLND